MSLASSFQVDPTVYLPFESRCFKCVFYLRNNHQSVVQGIRDWAQLNGLGMRESQLWRPRQPRRFNAPQRVTYHSKLHLWTLFLPRRSIVIASYRLKDQWLISSSACDTQLSRRPHPQHLNGCYIPRRYTLWALVIARRITITPSWKAPSESGSILQFRERNINFCDVYILLAPRCPVFVFRVWKYVLWTAFYPEE